MCARYTLYHPVGLLASHFAALSDGLVDPANAERIDEGSTEPIEPRYNIAPTERVVVVLEDGERVLRTMRWGLVPSWAAGRGPTKPLVNARAETLLEKPSFREALRKRRCIIPASGFYEWKKAGKERLPYHISRVDGEPMAFAGLWEPGIDEQPPTCTVVTVAANNVIEPLHDRMPAILGASDEKDWLDVRRVDAAAALPLLRPCPAEWIQMIPVSPRMNRLGIDDADCIVRAEHASAEEPSLFGAEW